MTEDPPRPQFGGRYLTQGEDVYAHNAWDAVEWDGEQEAEARATIASRSGPPAPALHTDLMENAAEKWDKFYTVHTNKFFKDRHWLFTEFPELRGLIYTDHVGGEENTIINTDHVGGEENTGSDTKVHVREPMCGVGTGAGMHGMIRVMEVGCGVGNTLFPILERTDDVFVYGCDYSQTAINIVQAHALYNPSRCCAFVADISTPSLDQLPLQKHTLDVITMIFVLSALNPGDMARCITNLSEYLKPGGYFLFRDYGRYDLAQLRFKDGRCLSENFYARGDGTKVYFFNQGEVEKLFTDAGLVKVQSIVDRRLQVNRARKLKMYRVWVQTKFKKL